MTTRFRKGFRYLAGSEDDGEPAEGIDDEEQEKLIRDLAAHDLATTAIYRASTRYSSEHSLRDGVTDSSSPENLPCLSSSGLAYYAFLFASILAAQDVTKQRIFYVLCIRSVLASLYTVYDASRHQNTMGGEKKSFIPGPSRHASDKELGFGKVVREGKRYIIPVNAVLCGTLWLLSIRLGGSATGNFSLWSTLPATGEIFLAGWYGTRNANVGAVIFVLAVIARRELRPVDVKELERLRYRYKGA